MTTWDVIQDAAENLQLIEHGSPVPDGWRVVAETANPQYLTHPQKRVLTRLEFRRRFTLAERVAVDDAPNNPALPAQARAAARTLLTDLSLAEEIDLNDPDVAQGLQFFASLGLIAPERVAQILG